jgi:hypothetical protein
LEVLSTEYQEQISATAISGNTASDANLPTALPVEREVTRHDDLAADTAVRDELNCLAHAGCHGFRLIEAGHDDGQLHVDSIRRIFAVLR